MTNSKKGMYSFLKEVPISNNFIFYPAYIFADI
jgi:hypothetical protein